MIMCNLFLQPCNEVSVTNDICYGNERGYWAEMNGVGQNMKKAVLKGIPKSLGNRNVDLTLDLYQPEGLSEKRPLILFLHGGAFYFGTKEEDAYVDFCRHFSSMGYITASINYRLGFHFNEKSVSLAVINAIHDARKALDFLADNAEKFHIDINRVFVAGSSSGGIISLKLAYGEDVLEHNYKILAVANLWGAVPDLGTMDGGTASVVSFHGDCDAIVPYGEGTAMRDIKAAAKLFPGTMYGSSCIDAKAEQLGLRHHLYTFPGEGHALNKDRDNKINGNQAFIKDKIAEFFYQELAR